MSGSDEIEEFKQSTIMMVDDEETTLDVLEMFLRDEGYSRFVISSDSTEALSLVAREKPDLILLDLMMPEVDGLEILEGVRGDATLRHIPVIILTSATDQETKLKALERGATDFLAKPLDESELPLRIRNTLAAKAYQDRLAFFDSLTGLPNRRLFVDRMNRELKRLGDVSSECAIVNIGLDRFKQINDTLGRKVGDLVLKECAERLNGCVLPSDVFGRVTSTSGSSPLSRIGGDEFSIFLSGAGCAEHAARVARRIISEMEPSIRVDGRELFVSCGVGIAHFPQDGEDIEMLLGKSAVALSHAKQDGREKYQFYSDSLNAVLAERMDLEVELRQAVERKELSLHYQPKVDCQTGLIVAAEALMRWEHRDKGFISPEKFIPVAEDAGLITEFGAWALRTACQQAKEWQDSGLNPIRMAVNVSSHQFRPGIVDLVRDALRDSGLAAQQLVLEVTESVIMEDPEQTAKMLHEIKDLGVRLSVDDFGTGYSSLAYLKSFPLAELKVDRSFIQGIHEDSDDAAIVTAIIALAHSLGLTVVAEGIESRDQLEFLKRRGCDECQGYFFGKPIPAEKWPELMANNVAEL